MAGLRNADGQIAINEQEAEDDIRRLQQAMSKLSEARQALNPDNIDNNLMRGDTRDALGDVLGKINRELADWEDKCNTAIQYINQTVARYKRIDREYAAKAGK